MDLKNKNLKLYKIFKGILAGTIITVAVLDLYDIWITSNITRLFYIIFTTLIGVEEVIVKKNKTGYLHFLMAVVVSLTLI